MAMLGEQFSEPNFIAGMEMKLRPQYDRIAIWIRDSSKTDAINKLRTEIVSLLSIVDEKDVELGVFKELKAKPFVKKDWKRGGKKPESEEQKAE